MKINPITFLLVIAFFYPLLKGFLFKYSSYDMKMEIEDVNKNIAFIISLFIGVHYGKKVFIQHSVGIYRNVYETLSPAIRQYIESKPIIIYFVMIPLLCYVIYKIIIWIMNLLNNITLYPLLDGIERTLNRRSDFIKRNVGMLVQLPKSVCYLLVVTFILNILSIFNLNSALNSYLETSKTYRYVCKQVIIPITNSKLAKQLPNIIGNSFKVVIRQEEPHGEEKGKSSVRLPIIYYNGVTLDEGIKSNEQIDDFARNLAEREDSIEGKSKILYTWVGRNISYDDEKAKKVMANDFDVESGTIPTFETRKGICFDYACLYAAMCRANGIKVRIITGEGFNGVSWVSHAWNQVYIPEKGIWINVDTTFYRGGNYFNSRRFEFDHKDAQIAGEW